MKMFDEDFTGGPKREAVELFRQAYEAQVAHDYDAATELYLRSIEVYPTAEAHTFLGWVYSFAQRYDEAIDECLAAIRVDPSFGNPYNDIGSYLLAQGDVWTCVRWFRRALGAPRYEARAFPHYNLGRVYEGRHRPLDAARHYGLAISEQPDFAQAAKALRRMQALLN
ncbi:MAG: hypothetical protein WCD76_01040 [Pyrinomonadaceae bacterium]